MKAITYKNTKTIIPGWVKNLHIDHPIGYAYETDTHFVHFFGADKGLHGISVGLTATEKKNGSLEDWVKRVFGAEDIKKMILTVGDSIEGIWRPSLYFYDDVFQALHVVKTEMRNVEQALRLLIERLDDIFLYIEPDKSGLNTYSHKTRELLILSCTEVENFWKYYITKSGVTPINGKSFTTKDYVKLVDKLYLREFEFSLKTYASVPPIIPFSNWDISSPTTSLDWYDAYNKTKHDRDMHFNKATLFNCIQAVVANLVMYSVRYSPSPLFEQQNMFSSLVNQHFDIQLVNTFHETYYLYIVELPNDIREDLICYNSKKAGYTRPFNVKPLTL